MEKRYLRCPTEFESDEIDRVLYDSCLEKKSRVDSIEFECEKIWDLWRKGEVSHEEVQRRLDEILGVEKSFFKELRDVLTLMVNARSPMKELSTSAYFNKREVIRNEIIKETDWVRFWQRCEWLKTPTQDDYETLSNLLDEEIADYHILICQSSTQLVDVDLEKSSEAQILREFYLLLKNEIASRPDMPKLPQKDAFLDYVQNKEEYVAEQTKMVDARRTGSMCLHCESTNVRSYNKAEWKCYNCGKRFRKH